jgi:hypothetical protein
MLNLCLADVDEENGRVLIHFDGWGNSYGIIYDIKLKIKKYLTI